VMNALRHAHATTCTVELRHGPGELLLTVRDDGRGLSQHDAPGLGLRSMYERALELGGTCAVSAPTAGGTEVRATLPLSEADHVH